MKKAYVRTEIYKFLNKKEKEKGSALNQQDIFNFLPELLSHLQSDSEAGMKSCTLEMMKQYATIGLLQAQHGFQWV